MGYEMITNFGLLKVVHQVPFMYTACNFDINRHTVVYADDTCLIFSGNSWVDVKKKATCELRKVFNFLNHKKLSINHKKNAFHELLHLHTLMKIILINQEYILVKIINYVLIKYAMLCIESIQNQIFGFNTRYKYEMGSTFQQFYVQLLLNYIIRVSFYLQIRSV